MADSPTPDVSLREKAETPTFDLDREMNQFFNAAQDGDDTRGEQAQEAIYAELQSLLSRVERAEAALKEATTPDICGEGEGGAVYYGEVEYEGLSESVPTWAPLEVWANRTLGMWWAARIPTEWDDEGDMTAESVRLFPSQHAATEAIFAAHARSHLPTPEVPHAL